MTDTQTTTPAQTPGNGDKRKRLLTILATVVVVALLTFGLYWLTWGRFHQSTEDAYVQGNIISVSSQLPGTVISINADDTDKVEAGSILIQLDDSDTKVALAQAKAQLAQTLRQIQVLYAQTSQLKASWQQAKRDYDRAQQLNRINGISTQDLQHARTALINTQSSYEAALARTEGTTPTTHPQVLLAIAHLKSAWLAEQRTHIKAPVTGFVAQRSVQLGQRVQPGSPLLAIVPLEHLWVEANFKETDIQNLRIGQPAKVESDVYGSSHIYHGKVAGLAAGTGSAFSLLPPQNATGNWIKVVQRLPVRITLDAADLAKYPLRVGLSTQVTIDTHNQSGATLAQSAQSATHYSTRVYQQNDDQLEQLIQQIIKANEVQTP
jgi:membrane fusion protein (multidrug efflux system)